MFNEKTLDRQRWVKRRRFRRAFMASRLLFFNLAPIFATKSILSRCSTPNGTEYDLYEPSSIPLATYLLVYGFTLAGEKDPRLVSFGRACAASGLRVAAPRLDGLKSYRLNEPDLETLFDLLNHLHTSYSYRIGMIGFSVGGSLALLTAADPRVSDWVDPLFLFSPYYSLADLYTIQTVQSPLVPKSQRDWDHFIWTQLVLAYRNIDSLDFSPSEGEGLLDILSRYCVLGLECKIDFYHRVLEKRRIPDLDETKVDQQQFGRFSPQGTLSGVKGRVFILHDPNDYLVPVGHSQKIIQELQQRGGQQPINTHLTDKPGQIEPIHAHLGQNLLVTPLVSHVSPHYVLRMREGLEVIMMFSELFGR